MKLAHACGCVVLLLLSAFVLPAEAAAQQTSRARIPSGVQLEAERTQRACDDGSMEACSELGVLYSISSGIRRGPDDVPLDDKRAVRLFRRACDGGYMEGCHRLASMYLGGWGVRQNRTRALDLFQRVCDSSPSNPCGMLRILCAPEGIKSPPDARTRQSACDRLQRSCDGGNSAACDGVRKVPPGVQLNPTATDTLSGPRTVHLRIRMR